MGRHPRHVVCLEEPSRHALRRLRWEAVAWGTDRLLWVMPAVLLMGMGPAFLLNLGWFFSVPVLLAFVVAWGVAVAVFWMYPRGIGQLPQKMDLHAGLPDQALAAAELPGEGYPWAGLQKQQAAAAYAGKDWKRLWPVPKPRWFWPRLGAMFLLAAACLFPGLWQVREERALAEAEAARRMSPELQQDLRALEELFQDWEKTGNERQDELQARLMKEVQPLRERLARSELNERQLLVELSKVEESLRAMQESLKADSVQRFADPLAKAFEPHAGMGALAAALRREAFEQSKSEAERLAEKFEQNQMALDPQRAKELAEELEKLAEQAREMAEQQKQQGREQSQAGQQAQQQMQAGAQSGTPQSAGQPASSQQIQGQGQSPSGQQEGGSNPQALSQAMQQMASGLRNGNGQQTASGMRQMAASMGREGGRQMQNGMMGSQLGQLGAGRQAMAQGQGQGFGQGAGQGRNPSEQMARDGGGAGTAADDQPFGAATELGGHATRVEVRGQASAGDSQVQVQRTLEPTFESVASGLEGARFRQYEKLSQEAVGNEALPVSHRQTIRNYFERIRPKNNPETAPAKETPP